MTTGQWTGIASAVLVSLLANGGLASAEEIAHAEGPMAVHVLVTPQELMWGPGPTSLPSGAQAAVLEGDPKQAGLFTMRIRLPANYRIAPHWHPADEHVTVISGTFNMGMGDEFDEAKGTTLPAGSFAVMPATMHHFAWTSEETIVQLHGMGPWQINYLNPTDDPRNTP